MDFPGEKVVTRLIDLLESGIGGFAKPWQIRRTGRANADVRAYERKLLERVESEINQVRLGQKVFTDEGKLIASDGNEPLLLKGPLGTDQVSLLTEHLAATSASLSKAEEAQRAINLKKATLFAEEEAEEIDSSDQANDPDTDVDRDWYTKWRFGAQDISREEMQRLWGKLLAGEVARPGRYSLHTIDFLSRMSVSDAELFARVAPFVTAGGLIRVSNEYFATRGLEDSDILLLRDLGLIGGVEAFGNLQFTLYFQDHNGTALSVLPKEKEALIFDAGAFSEAPASIKFNSFSVTKVGLEILSLASFSLDTDYAKEIAAFAHTQGVKVVSIGTLGKANEIVSWKEISRQD